MPTTDAAARVRAARHWAFLPQGRLGAIRDDVRRLRDDGVTGVLVPQIFAPPWAALGAAAACDEEIELASGIAMAFVRSPLETAMAALDLDRLSGGRFTLGLGSSVRAWNVERFGVDYDRPVARLRELVTLVKRMVTLDEQPGIGRFDGEFWHVDLDGIRLPRPIRPTVPITLAPLRTAMTELSAEVADGILGHPVWSERWITGEVRAAVERGLARAGRRRDEIRITAWLRVAITDDLERGRDDARVGLPFYASLRQYDSYFEALGLADDARRLQDLAERGAPPAEQAASISDAMVDELVIIGPPDEVAARIAAVLDVVDDVCITAPNGLPAERTRHYDEAIAASLRPGAARP